ncbi:hypothetical protein JVT61DRAFT_15253 [Boletus reticuloceps]|uniref:PX domain-containing protein n=1 Tax=Boletus reticuloceps TaxID=495285 RepID=A0A8I3ABK5_9AGAM|nr:hypothetical protein JVT61DRAFT_15253 [Boletus reticuloceps]
MATLPQNSTPAFTWTPAFDHRPRSDHSFDARINSSAAWTEHLDRGSLSSDEPADYPELYGQRGLSARELYQFEGKAEFRELTVEAGDKLEVLKQDVGDGWSLVKKVDLLPTAYYTHTIDFLSAPADSQPISKELSTDTVTPHASPKGNFPPLLPQTTGEWPIIFLMAASQPHIPHFVDEGPAWQPKIPEFRVLVHSPSKRSSGLSGAYTVYKVTSLVHSPEKGKPHEEIRSASPIYITVQRRFSHFVVLHTALLRRLPGIALTPLPEKQYAGRFNAAFVEARRGDLERYLDRVVRHPIARYAEVVTSFLGCEDDLEWTRMMPRFLLMRAAGPSFFAHVFHPAFNFDIQDASEVIEKFNNHVRAVGKGVQGLRSTFNRVREARIEMSKAEPSLSYSLLSLITATPSLSAPALGADEEEENASPQLQGLSNNDGAWYWREDCQDCLNLTKAVQKTAETLQSVADLYDDHVGSLSLHVKLHAQDCYRPEEDNLPLTKL